MEEFSSDKITPNHLIRSSAVHCGAMKATSYCDIECIFSGLTFLKDEMIHEECIGAISEGRSESEFNNGRSRLGNDATIS